MFSTFICFFTTGEPTFFIYQFRQKVTMNPFKTTKNASTSPLKKGKKLPINCSALASFDDLSKAIILDPWVGYKTRKYKNHADLTRRMNWKITSIIEEFKVNLNVNKTTTRFIDSLKGQRNFWSIFNIFKKPGC